MMRFPCITLITAAALLAPLPAVATTITIVNADESGEGFNLSNTAVTIPGAGGLILFILVYSVLYGYLWGVRGRSPGMSVTGIQVAGFDGKNLGFGKGVVRALFGLLLPGWLLIFFNSRKQALHDMLSKSMVIT